MPSSHSIDFRPTDFKDKKTAILAVISFNDANSIPYSKGKLYEYFGVIGRSVQRWCAAESATATATASTPAPKPETILDSTPGQGKKRSRSEIEVSSTPTTPGSNKGPKATRKVAQGQKKRKMSVKNGILDAPSPEQLLTVPDQIPSRQKQRTVDDSMGSFQHRDESSDEYVA